MFQAKFTAKVCAVALWKPDVWEKLEGAAILEQLVLPAQEPQAHMDLGCFRMEFPSQKSQDSEPWMQFLPSHPEVV